MRKTQKRDKKLKKKRGIGGWEEKIIIANTIAVRLSVRKN
jgi:hypothetical protein